MKINYTFADGETSEVEVTEEIGNMVLDSRREEMNRDRKERYHCYSLDAAVYEGKDYTDSGTPESALFLGLENHRMYTIRMGAIDNLTAQMNGSIGGYKLTEYDEQGRWIRDLYMDTPDKDTATKVLQINMNGIGGSASGYEGPYRVGMTLDGQIYGDRIIAGSVTAEKLDVSYTSQVERKISAAEDNANKATDEKLKSYYTISQINTKFTGTDGKIEASMMNYWYGGCLRKSRFTMSGLRWSSNPGRRWMWGGKLKIRK